MPAQHWFIKNCRLFDRLSDEQCVRIERGARTRRFPKSAAIYLPSDALDGVFLLIEGRIKLGSTTPDGKQAILAFIEPGELFGELALVEDGNREERAEAMIASEVLLLNGTAVRSVLAESAELALGVTKLIGLRRRRVERRLRSLLYRSNRDRLVHLLVDLCEQYGTPTPEGLLLSLHLSHQELASIIGATRETVTALLGELQLEGYIRVRRQTLVVRDRKKLEKLLAEDRLAPPSEPHRPASASRLPADPAREGR
jgi:CRP/FNR family cyclic AMP-dependent transcriptional regulator